MVAVQTAASSGAHLTKYSNITDPVTGQKKLIVDEAIVPPASVFDYGVTLTAPMGLTLDGGLDGIAHAWEVFMGATGQAYYDRMKEVATACLGLIVYGLAKVKADPGDRKARHCLGLGTDLGGYSIMIGGTSGPHLGSFSLIDVLSHGRACAILNPYYTVLFAPKIQDQLDNFRRNSARGRIYQGQNRGQKGKSLSRAGGQRDDPVRPGPRIPGNFGRGRRYQGPPQAHDSGRQRPAVKMKLQNMPTPMESERGDVDRLMRPTLEAAFTGNLDLIPEA